MKTKEEEIEQLHNNLNFGELKMKKQKIYDLVYYGVENNTSLEFTHPNNKFQMEFEQDCQDTLREFGEDYINNCESWVGTGDLVYLIAEKLPLKGYIPIDDVFERICYGISGDYIIRPSTNPPDYEDKIKTLLGAELLEKVYNKNKEIENRI